MVTGGVVAVFVVTVLPPKCANPGVDFGIGTQAILEIEVGIENVAIFTPVVQASGDFNSGILRGEEAGGCALAVNVAAAVEIGEGCADFEVVLFGGDVFQTKR